MADAKAAESPPEVDFGNKAPGIVNFAYDLAVRWVQMSPEEQERAREKAAAADLEGKHATAGETGKGSREGDYHHGFYEVTDERQRALLAYRDGVLCASAPLVPHRGRGAA